MFIDYETSGQVQKTLMTGLDRLERELAQKRFHGRVYEHPVGEYLTNSGYIEILIHAFITSLPDSEKD